MVRTQPRLLGYGSLLETLDPLIFCPSLILPMSRAPPFFRGPTLGSSTPSLTLRTLRTLSSLFITTGSIRVSKIFNCSPVSYIYPLSFFLFSVTVYYYYLSDQSFYLRLISNLLNGKILVFWSFLNFSILRITNISRSLFL